MAFPHPEMRRVSADGLRRLQVRLLIRRGGSAERPGRLLLMAAVVISSLPWLGVLLAYVIEANWLLSAAQARGLQMVRAVCAAVLLAEWIFALAVGIAWFVILLIVWARRLGAGSGTVSASDARESASPR